MAEVVSEQSSVSIVSPLYAVYTGKKHSQRVWDYDTVAPEAPPTILGN
ncbi:hypothetical protein COO91_10959 (plasmid) [Nostoc flagelliforme CCNUN1]|uniref:Uncharacterized protein n=1 Tax=Nostoc flagelliforme CCNUN1 TaxID=2038116 RepID=A0A2K8TAN6_9NOSO|nr:hypothetical protein COO91_10959 [Nostoc flagelliforme CCNUN1]